MAIGIDDLRERLDREIAQIEDPAYREQVRAALSEPRLIDCGWDYGETDQVMPCWIVVESPGGSRPSAIVHCDQGFGPRCPWGLIWLPRSETEHPPRMGQDFGWFPTFLEAWRDWV